MDVLWEGEENDGRVVCLEDGVEWEGFGGTSKLELGDVEGETQSEVLLG